MSKRRPVIEDEFTIRRPRWIAPVAILGMLLLFLGIAMSMLSNNGADPLPVRITGTTIVGTTVAPTTTTP
ncbi:MAG: hypothetical protein F2754_13020 [Actinobacteria bacterium]|uniref:Unannotated protein n=1 Tax=freshwater metagenome TaxID=449393 RepID=A0A6J6VR93_9ZZZZ|nr:hypothetical protein [Actinomycetota bacterium]MSW90779.1 hypothetical protein [Actinomycetota bacterium]MSX88297.1 hypothetical protein [Actinomycetota bacterium]MSY73512.1 hypothetical protein [Actinomycetota bacterium]